MQSLAEEEIMIGDLTRNWWLLVLRGVLSILFGVVCFLMPGIALASLVLVFGAYALVDGVFAIVSATMGQSGRPWWALVLRGIAGIATGIITIFLPAITAISLLMVIAAWAIVGGVLEISAAIRLRKLIVGEWLLGLAGLASIVFGAMLFLSPGAGALAVLWIIASYAIVFGVLFIVLGFKLRRAHGRIPQYEPFSQAA
jgi:uncharacterized membrane protein HdeD (DUF308 family)